MKLENRIAVITGAASGIGRALAEVLSSRGARLVLIDVDAAGAAAAAGALSRPGAPARALTVDVSDRHAMEEAAATVQKELGAVHLLVNNAGVSVAGPFEEMPLDDLRWIFEINFWGMVYGCRYFLPLLRAADEARIVNVLSLFGLIGFPEKTGYCATKFAARGFGEALRTELHGSNVGLTVVYPPAVDTNIARRGRVTDTKKRDAEVEFLARNGVPAPKVAERIARAIERNQARVLIGKEVRATDIATRAAPVLTQKTVGAMRKRIPFA